MSASSPSDHDMSDSSSSGTSYTRQSPYNSPSQQVPQLTTDLTELTCIDKKIQFLGHATKPFLRIIEQPQNHFRFRYVSEMIGTHGCLLGKSTVSNKPRTHPTVELVNYHGQALIRCHLAQHNKPDEHPHKLLEDEQDRDVSQKVPEQGSYKVAFGGIGIIHTAKKDVPGLLMKKFLETNRKPIVNMKDVQTRCENIAKTINLNIVRLKFSAHDIKTGEEICEPVFSEPIQNMKSAATNDLKICRISCSSGSASGGEDVFILVEKVNKKNIQVRFFELDDNGDRVWTANGQFVQSDVHHQYAIVFRTPPYKDKKTPVNVKVYIELLRPSDGHTSEPKEFIYRAEPAYKQIKKRKTNSSYCSIGSSSSGSLKSVGDIPISVANQGVEFGEPDSAVTLSMYPINQIQYPTALNDCDLGSALASSESSQSPMWNQNSTHITVIDQPIKELKLNSSDFDMENQNIENRVFSEGITQYLNLYLDRFMDKSISTLDKPLDSLENRLTRENMVPDSGRPTAIKVEKQTIESEMGGDQGTSSQTTQKDNKTLDNIKSEYSAFYTTEDGIEVKKLVKELCDTIRDKRGVKKHEQVIRDRLERLFNIRLSNGDTFLHMSLCAGLPSLNYIVNKIYQVKATHLLDCVNDRQQTILHLAILHDMPKTVVLLVSKGANPLIKDADELNAIHYGVKYKTCLEPLLDAIKKCGTSYSLDEYNGVKQSALHMAVVDGSSSCAKLLLKYGASTSVRDQHGRTPLHLAAYDDRINVIKILLEYIPESEIDAMDDSGNTALQIVCGTAMRQNTLEIAKLLLEKKANPMKKEEHGKSAWHLAKDNDELKSLLWKYADPVPMDEDDIKSEPEDEYESADEGEWSEVGLQELSVYAREVSVLLDAAGAWRALAHRLRLDALSEWYASQPSPTLTLLNHLKESRDDITSKSLALILEEMGQVNAASVIRRYIE